MKGLRKNFKNSKYLIGENDDFQATFQMKFL